MKMRWFVTCVLPVIVVGLGMLTACGGGGGSSALVVASEGIDLVSYSVSSNGNVTEIDRASLPSPGLLAQHAIFGITKYPSKKVLYVGSLNECGSGSNACWGNGRIDRFTYSDSGNLSYDGMAFYYGSGSGPACADISSGNPGQDGYCAPTTVAFSSDGSRAYVDDDNDDVVQIFSVDGNGDFTFLWEGSSTSYNGLTVSPNDNYLYNGESVTTLTGDTAAVTSSGQEGNATEIAAMAGTNMLISTLGNDELAVYTLADESAPAKVDTLMIPVISTDTGPGPAVYQDATSDLSKFVVVGDESVSSVGFDGSTLSLLDQVADADTTTQYIYRSVAVTDNGYALVSWFNKTWDNATGPYPGGLNVYEVAGDGTLTMIDTIGVTDGVGRASLTLRK